MRYSGTWLTPEDETILEHLRGNGPASPDELAELQGLDASRPFIEQRCSKLAGKGRLVVYTDDRYRLTGRGADYLDGALDPSELDRD